MILEEETFEKFGYYPKDIKPQSHKKVLAIPRTIRVKRIKKNESNRRGDKRKMKQITFAEIEWTSHIWDFVKSNIISKRAAWLLTGNYKTLKELSSVEEHLPSNVKNVGAVLGEVEAKLNNE